MQPLHCDLWLMEPNAFRQFVALLPSPDFTVEPTHEPTRWRVATSFGDITDETPEMAAERSQTGQKRTKMAAILPIHGVLEPRDTIFSAMGFTTSMESIGRSFDALVADESISGIILDVASPGGMVYGTPELAAKIHSARGKKPILAVANPVAASAAYWIASAADRLIVTPSGDVGSVGVIAQHVDVSKKLEQEGETETVIRSTDSPFKGETVDSQPLSDEAKAHLQSRADAIHGKFMDDLARFRGKSYEYVREKFGKGRMVDAESAVRFGMADRVDTLQATAVKLATGRIRLASEAAQDDWDWFPRKDRLNRVERFKASSTN